MTDHESHQLVGLVVLFVTLALDGCVGDRVNSNARVGVECPPQGTWYIEKNSLAYEHQWDPLIVSDPVPFVH